jgi:serine/threonine protein kinase
MSSGTELLGTVLQDRYKVEKLVARGGMAWVYRAAHIHFNVPVALKILYPHLADKRNIRRRFLEEARIQFKIHHPHLVRVTDILDMEHLLGMVQEWVEGTHLLSWVQGLQGALEVPTLSEIMIPVLEGVAEAHRHGVIHRDLKPGNILLSFQNGRIIPKVTDFGIAKVFEGQEKTLAGSTIGTVEYMSPEQIRDSKNIDLRSDIYSLGVIMYWMTTRQLPFQGDDQLSLMKAHIYQEPLLPRTFNPRIDPNLEQLVLRCLSKQPEQRPQSCDELRDGLLHVLQRQSGGVPAFNAPNPSSPLTSAPMQTPSHDTVVLIEEDENLLDDSPQYQSPLDLIEEELSSHRSARSKGSSRRSAAPAPNFPKTPIPQEDAVLEELEQLVFSENHVGEGRRHPLTRSSPNALPYDSEDIDDHISSGPTPVQSGYQSSQSHQPAVPAHQGGHASTFQGPYASSAGHHAAPAGYQHQYSSQPPQPAGYAQGGYASQGHISSPPMASPHPVSHSAPPSPGRVSYSFQEPPPLHPHANPAASQQFHSPYAGQAPQPQGMVAPNGSRTVSPASSQQFYSPYAGQTGKQSAVAGAAGQKQANNPYAGIARAARDGAPSKKNPLAEGGEEKKGLTAFQVLIVIPLMVLIPAGLAAGFIYFLQQQVKPAPHITVRDTGNLKELGLVQKKGSLSKYARRERALKKLKKQQRFLYSSYKQAVERKLLSRSRRRYFEKNIWAKLRSKRLSGLARARLLRKASRLLKRWTR